MSMGGLELAVNKPDSFSLGSPQFIPGVTDVDRFDLGNLEPLANSSEYILIIDQITPDGGFLDKNLDAVSEYMLQAFYENGLISRGDYKRALDNMERKTTPTNDPVMASHPVYRVRMMKDDGKLVDVVMKFGDNTDEAKAYQAFNKKALWFFKQHKDLNVPELALLGEMGVNGEDTNVIATKYIDGKNLTEFTDSREGMFKYGMQAVEQMVALQERGVNALELEDVVAKNPDYFTSRVSKTFFGKFMDIAEPWLNPVDIEVVQELQGIVTENYSAINRVLAKDSLENGVMYVDGSPMNLRVNEDKVYALDLAGGRKLSGWLGFISLTEFGKKHISDADLEAGVESGACDYLSGYEKRVMFDRALLKRAAERDSKNRKAILNYLANVEDPLSDMDTYKKFVSGSDREEAQRVVKFAGLQRHLEYTGYASRDMANTGDWANEFNRQRYHMRMAVRYAKEILNTERLTRQEFKEVNEVLYSLQCMNNIIEKQAKLGTSMALYNHDFMAGLKQTGFPMNYRN